MASLKSILILLAAGSFIFVMGAMFYTMGAGEYGAPVDSNLVKINSTASGLYDYAHTWAKEKPVQLEEKKNDIFSQLKDFATGLWDLGGLFFSAAVGIVLSVLTLPLTAMDMINAAAGAVGLPALGTFVFIVLSIYITIMALLFLAKTPDGG